MLVVTALARGREGAMRAFLFGSAAGFGFALQTAVTKQFDTEIGSGVLAFLADWSVYVLVASAVAGFVLQQSALKTGVLAPAMASSNAVSLFVGVILGAVIYGETLTAGSGHVAPAILGLLLAVGGVIVLARTGGPDGEPAPGGGAARPASTS
jgi:hypothetical protein